MTKSGNPSRSQAATGPSVLATAVNILVAPGEAFSTIRTRPTILFPLLLVAVSTMLVIAWYFRVLDYDWYIDDTLARLPNLSEAELETARERMAGLSQRNLMLLSTLSSGAGLVIILLLQAGYLTLVSALHGDEYRFRQWFSLAAWTGLPGLLSTLSMAINIWLNPSGQVGIYDLNSLSLYNLGMQTANESLNQLLNGINLPMLWSLGLVIVAYRQWLQAGPLRALIIVTAPYLLIFGVLTYFALR
jgi:hypothetical protein